MPYQALADFLEELADRGELARIAAEVDPHLEIAEITRRVAADGGPALLFERVRGQSMPLVANLLGTEARACRALNIESLDDIAARVQALVDEHTPRNWFDRLKMSGDATGAEKFRAKPVKTAPCQQVALLGRDVDLSALPLVRAWPAESGPGLCAAVVTEDGATQNRAVTAAALVALDERRLAVADDGHSPFARHWAACRAAGPRMPAAIVVGGDPAAMLAAHLELPEAIDAYQAVGLLRGRPLEVAKCRTHDLEVPAAAELVIEGYFDAEIPPVEIVAAAAGGTHYRALPAAPVFHASAVTHRSRPLFALSLSGEAAGEARVLAKARERLLLPALAGVVPDVVDLHLPVLGGQHRFAFVALRKRRPFQARQVAAALWGSDALRFTKFLILVDHDQNVHDVAAVLAQVGANVAPERDLFDLAAPVHGSDHAAGDRLGRHLAIDATTKLPGERPGGWPQPLEAGDDVRRRVSDRWTEYQLAAARARTV